MYQNNYYNPYAQYPYSSFPNQPPMPQQQGYQMNQGNNTNIQQPQQPMVHPLIFVSGIEGAKAYMVSPGQTVYFLDSDKNNEVLYIKSADREGRYTFTTKQLTDLSNDVKQPKKETAFVNMEEFNAFKCDFEERLNILSSQLEKHNKQENNKVYKGDK